jgi:hypothetical protein
MANAVPLRIKRSEMWVMELTVSRIVFARSSPPTTRRHLHRREASSHLADATSTRTRALRHPRFHGRSGLQVDQLWNNAVANHRKPTHKPPCLGQR